MPNDTLALKSLADECHGDQEADMSTRWSRSLTSGCSQEIDSLTTAEAEAYVEQRKLFEHGVPGAEPKLGCR